MTTPLPVAPAPAQVARLHRFSIDASVDIHCHCLPGLDDGPPTLADALAVCRGLVDDGITTVIATPHQLGTYEQTNGGDVIRAAVAELNATLHSESIPLQVLPGGDVRVDDGLMDGLAAGRVLSLGDARQFILLELPHESLIDLTHLVDDLLATGVTPVLSHPERNAALVRKVDPVLPWIDAGMLMQVTAGSLLGQFGPHAERVGWSMIEQGLVAIVATDAHDVKMRPPSMSAAIDAIAGRYGHAVARRLCVENPLKVLRGDRAGLAAARRQARPTQREPQLPPRRRRFWGWFS
jgi:protein-tyrosine phosphatase